MNQNPPSPNAAAFDEVLMVLHQYLSDLVPPLMLVNEGETLLRVPPQLLSGEIERWVAAQYRSGENAPASDYLYHVARKIHQIGDLQIFSEGSFLPFQQKLTKVLVQLCPEADRERLIADLEQLSAGRNIEGAPVHVEHRGASTPGTEQAGPGEPAPAPVPPPVRQGSGTMAAGKMLTAEHVQRLELLLRRLETVTAVRPAGGAGAPGTSPQEASVVAEAVISAAETADNAKQLQEFLATFNVPNLPSSPGDLLAVLAQRLPDWAPPAGQAEESGPSPRTVKAMRKVVATADNAVEAGERYKQLVETAAKEFNRGSLGRAVTLLDLAQRMVEKKEIDESYAGHVIERGQELLDFERLKAYAATGEAHALLRRVLSFFRDLSPSALLSRLETEDQREQRRVTLELLKVHGPATRSEVFKWLEASIKHGGTLSWYFERNLILLLRDIPPADDEDLNRQIDVLLWLARPGGPLASVREALSALGAIHHKRSESTLTATISDLERALTGELELPYSREEIQGLLDRAVGALASMPTRDARRRVVRHALDRKAQAGQAIKRLEPLGQQNLADDFQLVHYLLEALLNELPMKVFGKAVLTPRRNATIASIIHALAGTDLPQVRKALSEVAQRFPGESFSTEAERVLANLGACEAADAGRSATMAGDLALLSFPNLLQNIGDAHLTGTLTLLDVQGATTATLTFIDGLMADATSGHLEGKTALFQILQAPDSARFVFTRSNAPEEAPAPEDLCPLLPLLLEGMRRLDELSRSEAIVPADATFRTTSKKPSQVPEERDEALMRKVWEAASTGQPAAVCEAKLPADSYRIRRMYEHWLQEGALAPKTE